jgi:hypothetical protein
MPVITAHGSSTLKTTENKFLTSGHSELETDTDCSITGAVDC